MIRSNRYFLIKLSILSGLFLIGLSCKENSTTSDKKIGRDTIATTLPKSSEDTPTKETNFNNSRLKHETYKEDINNLPPSIARFVPEGYTALDTVSGDLNLDDHPDMIIVLKKNGEDTSSDVSEDPEKRPLLILIGEDDNNYKQVAKSENAVYCIDCGGMMGDPFMKVVIKKGFFSIEHYGGSGWRWTRTITFKYSPKDNYWYLHKDGNESFHVNNPSEIESKIYTTKDFGKIPFDKFDIYKTIE